MDFVYSFDWYDGPRSGIATYNGRPHYFESQWADIDHVDEDWFKLSPVSQEVFELELEREHLWSKYATANKLGTVGAEHHPFLPVDRQRGEELIQILEKVLRIDEAYHLIGKAEFIAIDELTRQANRAEMIVNWIILPSAPSDSKRVEYNL